MDICHRYIFVHCKITPRRFYEGFYYYCSLILSPLGHVHLLKCKGRVLLCVWVCVWVSGREREGGGGCKFLMF